jgi:hypothetical protein
MVYFDSWENYTCARMCSHHFGPRTKVLARLLSWIMIPSQSCSDPDRFLVPCACKTDMLEQSVSPREPFYVHRRFCGYHGHVEKYSLNNQPFLMSYDQGDLSV